MLKTKFSRVIYLESINLNTQQQKVALVTGAAGFIGFYVSRRLLDEGWCVIGVDCMSDFYDISLKEARENILLQNKSYISIHQSIEAPSVLMKIFEEEKPDIVIHLAAQAGVRYSIENPRSYLKSNIIGTFELLEAAKAYPPKHMLLASTSSAYGANKEMPYKETDKADHQVSFYAATKKSTENIAHSYSHIYELPITMFRFFTVYGPWGRPDMALFKFTKAILEGNPIELYNKGKMKRDFTYIEDIVNSILLLMDKTPNFDYNSHTLDSLSPVAPFRIINIGNTNAVSLIDFVKAIECAVGVEAKKIFLPMQPGDVHATWANSNLLQSLTGYTCKTDISTGVKAFVEWYCSYYDTK
jgi:UDP-glucuronate 4-epimerase